MRRTLSDASNASSPREPGTAAGCKRACHHLRQEYRSARSITRPQGASGAEELSFGEQLKLAKQLSQAQGRAERQSRRRHGRRHSNSGRHNAEDEVAAAVPERLLRELAFDAPGCQMTFLTQPPAPPTADTPRARKKCRVATEIPAPPSSGGRHEQLSAGKRPRQDMPAGDDNVDASASSDDGNGEGNTRAQKRRVPLILSSSSDDEDLGVDWAGEGGVEDDLSKVNNSLPAPCSCRGGRERWASPAGQEEQLPPPSAATGATADHASPSAATGATADRASPRIYEVAALDDGHDVSSKQALLRRIHARIQPAELPPFLVTAMRPHQLEGVLFMYECVAGLRRRPGPPPPPATSAEDGDGGGDDGTSGAGISDGRPRGCILADGMGLGKTLQVSLASPSVIGRPWARTVLSANGVAISRLGNCALVSLPEVRRTRPADGRPGTVSDGGTVSTALRREPGGGSVPYLAYIQLGG
jgi:hypothetical protein